MSEKSSVDNVKIGQVKEIKWPASETGGVMPMSIESRFAEERHRLSEDYTEKWRKYRIKYIKSLILEHQNPKDVPALYKVMNNPIRRFYKAPMNYFEKLITPYLGKHYARKTRFGISWSILGYFGILYLYYNYNYSKAVDQWDHIHRISIWSPRPTVLPGDPIYPLENPKPYDWQFADRNFSKRKSHLNVE